MAAQRRTKRSRKPRHRAKPGYARTLRDVARHFDKHERTVGSWKANGMPVAGPDGYNLAEIQRWRDARRMDKHPAMDPQRRELLNAQLAADVKYRIAKAQAAERAQARANQEYADDALELLAEWIVSWKAQIQSWVPQALLVIPEEHRPEVKRLLEAKVDRLLEDMARVIT